jgi:hypothetical protein
LVRENRSIGKQLTLDVPDEVFRSAEYLAAATRRDVAAVLQEALALALPPLEAAESADLSVERLSDERVLALCAARLSDDVDDRLSDLLDRRQAGKDEEADRAELAVLMRTYQSAWLRQSAALSEAVRRGLRPPLAP